jgi:cyclase
MDCVASLYGRNHLAEIIKTAALDIFVPLTVGGGIRTVDNATEILRAGADKVAINTGAVANPDLISDVARRFGSQCMVLSVEAKQISSGQWEVMTDNGRERTGLDVVDWVKEGVKRGAGEILLTSVDREGTRKGFDLPLLHAVTSAINVPVIASGGMGQPADLVQAVIEGGANAVAMADILHYDRIDIGAVRLHAQNSGLKVRRYEQT